MEKEKYLIETQNLCKYYPVKKQKLFEKQQFTKAVSDLNIGIPEGCTFGLVGESGCGKSTTGQVLAGIYKATSGRVFYRGEDLMEAVKDRNRRKEVRKKIQMVFQDPYASLNPKKKIGWILEEPLSCGKDEKKKLVKDILETVGLDESYADKYPGELSGGQRQRVSIAAALILEPEFVICDEAVSALDVSVQAQILNLLIELQKKRNLTYLFISHDLNVVEYMSDYIGVMYLGRLVEWGKAEEVYKNPLHPYTQALLSAVPDIDSDDKVRIVLEGEVPDPADMPEGCPFHTRCRFADEKCKMTMPEMKAHGQEHTVCCHYAEGGIL